MEVTALPFPVCIGYEEIQVWHIGETLARHVPLPDECRVIARFFQDFQEGNVLLNPWSQVVPDTMRMGVLSCEEAGPAWAAEGGCNEGIRKQDSFPGQTVQVGGHNEGVAGTSHEVPPLIVGQDEDDVGRLALAEGLSWREAGK